MFKENKRENIIASLRERKIQNNLQFYDNDDGYY